MRFKQQHLRLSAHRQATRSFAAIAQSDIEARVLKIISAFERVDASKVSSPSFPPLPLPSPCVLHVLPV
jgi:hypothetical protein